MACRAPFSLVLRWEFRPACPWSRAITELGSLGLDDVRCHRWRLVAEARADIRCDCRDFGVGKLVAERRHDAVEWCAFDRDWPVDAEKQDFGYLARVGIYPFRAGNVLG